MSKYGRPSPRSRRGIIKYDLECMICQVCSRSESSSVGNMSKYGREVQDGE
jgi:hypothetical protein